MLPISSRLARAALLSLALPLCACGPGGLSAHDPDGAGGSVGPAPPMSPSPCASRAATPYAGTPSPAGPRQNIDPSFLAGVGFDAFSVVEPGVLSRSGTPVAGGFAYLLQHGWRGIVDVRTTDDRTYTDFPAQFHYLQLPLEDAGVPTEAMMRQFLCFVADPQNRPVDVHDVSGTERVDAFVAVFRYSAQGWPMDAAMREESLYGSGLSSVQRTFLLTWAQEHPPGVLP